MNLKTPMHDKLDPPNHDDISTLARGIWEEEAKPRGKRTTIGGSLSNSSGYSRRIASRLSPKRLASFS